MTTLNGRVVLVTGAARGIGAAVAREAAGRGARVALTGLEPELLASVHSGLPGTHSCFAADVTDQAQLDAACEAAARDLGGIDVVVANAGVANIGTVAVGDFDALLRTIEVNLVGVVRTVRAALPYVTERRGYVQVVSSAAAFTVLPGMAAYCAAKAGVEQFANALRLEQVATGVGVGIVHPSWIDTDLVRDMRTDLASFERALRSLPWPMAATTSVERCAVAMVDGIVKRKRRVYVPRAVGLVQALRPLVLSPLGDALIRRRARVMVPVMEAETRALGRGFGTHSVGGTRAAER